MRSKPPWNWANWLGVVVVVLVLCGCTTVPTLPPRDPVPMPDLVQWQPPPDAELVPVDGAFHACYTIDDAAQLADSLDSAEALSRQAASVARLARVLDAEAAEHHEALRSCVEMGARERNRLLRQVWLQRAGSVLGVLLLLGLAL